MRNKCNVFLKTNHIHIKGIVQGVGFRPFVYKHATELAYVGWVNNTNDGVHIHLNINRNQAISFLNLLLKNLPPLAIVTDSLVEEVPYKSYSSFEIIHSKSDAKPNLLLTPDAAICEACKEELHDVKNRRHRYPFITCTNCGPRYSIIKDLPYDRPLTTMAPFKMCKVCQAEYDNHLERRHYSQTNSCKDCRIEMQLFEKGILHEKFTDLNYILKNWEDGKIIAIKGIGGYLLTCDATNIEAIKTLRKRKKRKVKPFALMYPNIESIQKDTTLSAVEADELQSIHAPIVLLESKKVSKNKLAFNEITQGLSKLGVMLPYTPLYELLVTSFDKPIVATSANITDSTIIYTDKKALTELPTIADIILLNNRKIVLPQDDSVIQFTQKYHKKITLRRSRGKAPTYINPYIKFCQETILATGAMLKSVFGILNIGNTYISQYMGNTASYDAQLNYEHTFLHFKKVFDLKVDTVVIDKHPDYFATRFGRELAIIKKTKVIELQHHKAHFYSVLGENNLLASKEPIMGIIWDGTGLGDDGAIWGGEFFLYEKAKMQRVYHIDEFDFILGDKMPKEPRISAFAIAHSIEGAKKYLKPKFTEVEWKIYQKLLKKENQLKSTSMGRLFDAVSSLLFGLDKHSYEAEASMKLEKAATQSYYSTTYSLQDSYLKTIGLPKNFIKFVVKSILEDLNINKDKQYIAVRFHVTLVDYIIRVATKFSLNKLAFSGGVFQNALLVDMLIEYMSKTHTLYFHKEFSPNDEGIAFGQLIYYNQIVLNNNK